MNAKLYYQDQDGSATYYIQFDTGAVLVVTEKGITQLAHVPEEASPYLWGGDVVGAIDNARLSGRINMNIPAVDLLLMYADMRNLYQPE